VPQGLVLGSLLFLIFLNNVAENMTGFGRLFVPDGSWEKGVSVDILPG
jgi:hypothetical protein